eukprot:gnl/TRDRNA2_/TRDRNA2_177329_c0_seq1.p1 gnl/TRDRNA2_/TRDRNA2_177329_c0~~gnl/TRDRNA2_/TRDRNA2_177329_c0_seq1.p1  ORF type:complete len:324 (-),score=-28.72 gnl/TRDRNA2_/TRDRNA2_177329_c0_seq1:753-1724(-)
MKLRSKFETFEITQIKDLAQDYKKSSHSTLVKFENLPISRFTLLSLKEHNFIYMSAVQQAVLPAALCGHNIIGISKTGTGKTIAFLLPVIEKLYRLSWNSFDNLGGIINTPSRELATQTFIRLQTLCKYHTLTLGLCLKSKADKNPQIRGINVIVCTPKALIYHMDKEPHLLNNPPQILVLDEADRILNPPFSHTFSIIFKKLRTCRQTLLFSATKIKNSSFPRLYVSNPRCFFVHAHSISNTPLQLQQVYIICDLQDKLSILWSFLNTHKKKQNYCFLINLQTSSLYLRDFSKSTNWNPDPMYSWKDDTKKKIKITRRILWV